MQILIINDKVITDIINNLTIDDKLKELISKIILRYDYSYINFIYSIFSVYTFYYYLIINNSSNFSPNDFNEIIHKFKSFNLNPDLSNIFIADIYDILYYEQNKYNSFFYDDMYQRLLRFVETESDADLYIEEVFDILDKIFSTIEEIMVFNLMKFDELTSSIVFYLEITNNYLIIYAI